MTLPTVVVNDLDAHLRQWSAPGREGFVFMAPDGHRHLDPDNFRRRIWLPAVAAAALAPLQIHDLRHPTASLAIAAGADVKQLQTMLGHASAVMTTDRYGHLMPGRAQDQDVADRLDTLDRAAIAEPIPPVVRLDARDFAGSSLRAMPSTLQKDPLSWANSGSSPASIRGPSAFTTKQVYRLLLSCAVESTFALVSGTEQHRTARADTLRTRDFRGTRGTGWIDPRWTLANGVLPMSGVHGVVDSTNPSTADAR